MPPKSESKRCHSPGILRMCHDEDTQRCDKKVKISIRDPSRPTKREEAEAENRRFEELKKKYFDKCAFINKNLVLRCSQPQDRDDPAMQLLKTNRGNPKAFDLGKKDAATNQEATTDRKKRNSRLTCKEELQTKSSGRSVKRGCGALGCECLNCVCGVNCQENCQCMRKT